MNSKIVTHKIEGDNGIWRANTECIGLDLEKIIVGVENSTEREIITNPQTGFNEARNRVEAQEVYNFKTKKHGFWFLLDLETGGRGWFPGCIIKGDTQGDLIPLKKEPSDESETLRENLINSTVQILDIEAIEDEPETNGWYKVLFDVEGYIKKEFITKLRYVDPTRI